MIVKFFQKAVYFEILPSLSVWAGRKEGKFRVALWFSWLNCIILSLQIDV